MVRNRRSSRAIPSNCRTYERGFFSKSESGLLGIDEAAFRSLVRNIPAEIDFDIHGFPIANR
jgi:hypothetical protein